MSVSLIEIGAFENMVRLSESALDVAEFKGDGLLNVGAPVPCMDPLALLGRSERLFNGKNGFQSLIFDIDIAEGLFGESLAGRRYSRHRIARIPHLFHSQCFFVLSRGHDAELLR